MFNKGKLIGTELTSKDVSNAFEVYGKAFSATAGKGKSLAHRVFPEEKITVIPSHVELEADFMFVKDYVFLVSVSVDVGLTIVTCVGRTATYQQDEDRVYEAIKEHIAVYAKSQFVIDEIRTDGQSFLASLAARLGREGIRMRSLTGHQYHVERRIGILKDIARTIENGLSGKRCWKQVKR